MSMSKKDFEVVADTIRRTNVDFGQYANIDHLIDRLCLAFKLVNPAFNAERFKKACQP